MTALPGGSSLVANRPLTYQMYHPPVPGLRLPDNGDHQATFGTDIKREGRGFLRHQDHPAICNTCLSVLSGIREGPLRTVNTHNTVTRNNQQVRLCVAQCNTGLCIRRHRNLYGFLCHRCGLYVTGQTAQQCGHSRKCLPFISLVFLSHSPVP
ncbi:hypothetical protein BvCmsKSNP073_01603 [Escherichia coli]|nr:hypothetical protein BvCmsKSNP073_01603 [Escherichia coli]